MHTTIRYSDPGIRSIGVGLNLLLARGLPPASAFHMLHVVLSKSKPTSTGHASDSLRALQQVERASIADTVADFARIASDHPSWSADQVIEHVLAKADMVDLTAAIVCAAAT